MRKEDIDCVVVKGVEELINQFNTSSYTAGFLSVVVALCYWATVYALELLPNMIAFTPVTRKLLSDYAYPVSLIRGLYARTC